MRVFDEIDHGEAGVLPLSKFVDLIEKIGGEGGVIIRRWRVIYRKYAQMKVLVWTILPF